VQLRRNNVDIGHETRARLRVREQEAALALELRIEEGFDLSDGHPRAREHLVEAPAGDSLRHEQAGVGIDERGADVVELERSADPAADAAEDLIRRRLAGDA